MSVTGRPIPKDFEVHHDDENGVRDCWTNLICLHRLDHRKMHHSTEEIPF